MMGKYINIQDNKQKINQSLENLDKLKGAKLKIGVFGEDDKEQVMIASVHEFGVSIEVTEKMQGWFMAQGFAPPQDTVEIPERSFIRRAFDSRKDDIISAANDMMIKVVQGNMTADKFMKKLGVLLVSFVQQTIDEVEKPPLSSMTKEMRKGGSQASPLQDTGKLWQSIIYEIEW